jgi:hypothetical protein
MFTYVFQSPTGAVSVGCQLRGREPVYSHPDVKVAQRFARRLKTSHGSTYREGLPTVDSRGNVSRAERNMIAHISAQEAQ